MAGSSTLIDDGEYVMMSALQHYLFCPRQCALIHVENVWRENFLTSAGRVLHERVDSGVKETRRDIHLATSLRLVSRRLGVTGVADIVEFYRVAEHVDLVIDGAERTAARLPNREGWWRPFPVEYKRGRPKAHRADEVQLCAQAVCLEEMLSVTIEKGALFYGETRRRKEVVFDDGLRELTIKTAAAVRDMIVAGVTPSPSYTDCCEACSLIEICRPRETSGNVSARRWLDKTLNEVLR